MTIFQHECVKHGHRFEARFEEQMCETALRDLMKRVANVHDSQAVRKLFVTQKYVHDICTRCGDIRRRGPDA